MVTAWMMKSVCRLWSPVFWKASFSSGNWTYPDAKWRQAADLCDTYFLHSSKIPRIIRNRTLIRVGDTKILPRIYTDASLKNVPNLCLVLNAVIQRLALQLRHILFRGNNKRRQNIRTLFDFFQLLDSVMEQMMSSRSSLRHAATMGADTSQLLVIVSDGHGLGDRAKLKAAVRRASEAHVFIVFVILENPGKPVSSRRVFDLLLRWSCTLDKFRRALTSQSDATRTAGDAIRPLF